MTNFLILAKKNLHYHFILLFCFTIPLKEDYSSKALIIAILSSIYFLIKKNKNWKESFRETSKLNKIILIVGLLSLFLSLISILLVGPQEMFKGNRLSFFPSFLVFGLIFILGKTKFNLRLLQIASVLFLGLSISGILRIIYGIRGVIVNNEPFFFTRVMIPFEELISSNPIVYGVILNFCYSCFLIAFLKNKINHYLFILLLVLTVLFQLNYTSLTGVITFLLINIICLSFYHFKFAYKGLIVSMFLGSIIGFAFIISPQGSKLLSKIEGESSRVRNYETSISVIKESPLLGYGVGNELHILQSNREINSWEYENKYHAHNQYFEMMIGGGFIYFALFFLFILLSVMAGLKRDNLLLVLFLFIVVVTMFIESLLVTHKGFIFVAFVWAYLLFNEIYKKDNKTLRS